MASETSSASRRGSRRGRLREGTDKRGYAGLVEAAGAPLADDSRVCAKPPAKAGLVEGGLLPPAFLPFLGSVQPPCPSCFPRLPAGFTARGEGGEQ